MMSVLWNPVGVLDILWSDTWGAPQGGDPRLCCITRTGLSGRILASGSSRPHHNGLIPRQEMWVKISPAERTYLENH